MAFQRPGVYVQEVLNPIQPVPGATSDSVATFVGENDRGPINTPTLISSWSQYTKTFGSWNTYTSNNLPLAVYMYFSNGGSQCYIVRAAATPVAAARSLNDRAVSPSATLSVTAKNAGRWGNNLNVSIVNSVSTGYFDLVVYSGGNTDSNVVETWAQLSMTASDSRYAPAVVNPLSDYVTLADLNSANTGATRNPAVVANQTLAGGTTGNTVTVTELAIALATLDTIQQSLILNLPGQTTASVVNTTINYAEARDDVFVVIDGIDDSPTNQLTLASSYAVSSLGAVYYPPITIADPTVTIGTTGRTLTVGAGAAIAGLIATTDASRGVFKAPAGLQARLAGVVSARSLTNDQLDSLNSAAAPVNAIRFVPGSGYVVMGSRTLKGGYVDKYVPVRRTLIYLRKSLTELTQFAIFEPNNETLWRRIEATVNSFLTGFWSSGGLRGDTPDQAFFVKVDAENNPQYLIDNGEVHIEVGVALQRPAEFVVIKIGQFDGGTTVTVA